MMQGLGNNVVAVPFQPPVFNKNINPIKLANTLNDLDSFQKSQKPSKKKLILKTLGQIGVIVAGAVGFNKLHNLFKGKNANYDKVLDMSKTGINTATSKIGEMKGKIPSSFNKILEPVKKLPTSFKIAAAGLSALMVARSAYRAGAKDGKHDAVSSIEKAQVFNQLVR